MGILLATHTATYFPPVGTRSACLLIARAVKSPIAQGIPVLAIVFARLLLTFYPRSAMPPGNNGIASRRGGPHPLDGRTPLTDLERAASVSAGVFCL